MYFNIESVNEHLGAVLTEFKQLFRVSDEVISDYKKEILQLIEKHSKFDLERA